MDCDKNKNPKRGVRIKYVVSAVVVILTLVITSFASPVFAQKDVVADTENGELVAAPPSQDGDGGKKDKDKDKDEDEDEDDESSPCSKAGQSLAWALCPVTQALSLAIAGGDGHGGIYGSIEENYLQINTNSFKSNDDSGSYGGWKEFRDYANIVFVIALVVIILSQITGFGVSNYGIKKMLPTLIVVAVLVNLSFFLCQLMIDLSNIVGYGANEIFARIAEGVQINADFEDAGIGVLVNKVFSTLIAGGISIAGAVIGYETWEFWLPPFVLLLIVTVIGILFFYVLLGIRQAGIVLLVALAPVAIVCYALPNTKRVFDRWWKLFSGLLLVYPICGVLVGGGRFASKLLLSTVGSDTAFFYTLVAILIQVVPFFFIPSILRSSFTAMGNLGARLSTFGRNLGRGATGAIRRSEGYRGMRTHLGWRNAERALSHQSWRDSHGLSVRGRASRWAGRRGIRGAIGNAAKRSRNYSQERRINATAERHRAEQNAAFVAARGLSDAERRERDTAMKNYESGYRGDDAFLNNFTAQSSAYEAAIDEVDKDPTNTNAVANLRALQNVLGSTSDGQDIMQNVLHRRLADAQSRHETTASAGLATAGSTLMSDHGGFKGNNRGLNKLSRDLANGSALKMKNGKYVNGTYAATELKDAKGDYITDKAGNRIIENNHYGAEAAKGSAVELAGASDSSLDGMLSSIQNGNMKASDMEAVYRNAAEAITNDNISVKPETEARLNAIRQAAYEKLQGQQVNGYTDSTGREFAHVGGNNYQYTDGDGNVHTYTYSGGGDMTEVGTGTEVVSGSDLTSMSQNYYDDQGRKFVSSGGGMYTYDDGDTKHTFTRNNTTGDMTEVGTGSEVITGNRMKTAADNFGFNYGNGYHDLHAGDTFKVGHNAPATPQKVKLPAGWVLTNSGWVDINTGSPLSPMDARRADSIVDHNNKIDNNS